MYWERGLFDGIVDKEQDIIFIESAQDNIEIARSITIAINNIDSMSIGIIISVTISIILGWDNFKINVIVKIDISKL
jgi:methionine synthase I (cobalamin-dependent)